MTPPLVLIPGTLCDARIFKRVTPKLRSTISVRYLGLDRLNSRQQWVRGLIRTLPNRFTLAGFSLGGLVALEILRLVPERVTGLALISSNAEAAGAKHRHARRHLTDRLRHWDRRRLCGHLKQRYFLSQRTAIKNRSTLVKMAQITTIRRALNQFKFAATRREGYSCLHNFQRPLLIMSGQLDSVCPANLQIKAARSGRASTLTLLPRCGHFSPLESPGRVSTSLLKWIKEAKLESENVHT
ncbi:MAG: hypothetical protein RLY30_193 [Pseudomonadota bacterium]